MPDHAEADRERRSRHRELWAQVNAEFTDGEAAGRWTAPRLEWGLFRRPERRVGALGDVAGLDVVELGCGTAEVASHLVRAGARVVALDLSPDQLDTARRCQRRWGPGFPLVEADAECLPLRDDSADLVVSEYGAAPWCRPDRWLVEAARVLRPGGRLVFLTHSPLVAMCVPAEGGVAGTELLRPQRSLRRVQWPGAGTEHHPGHGDWLRELRRTGFEVQALHELYAPDHAARQDYYEIVTPAWAGDWPAEDLWVAHLVDPQRWRRWSDRPVGDELSRRPG
jgi:SAM-dependent methyltransferase